MRQKKVIKMNKFATLEKRGGNRFVVYDELKGLPVVCDDNKIIIMNWSEAQEKAEEILNSYMSLGL